MQRSRRFFHSSHLKQTLVPALLILVLLGLVIWGWQLTREEGSVPQDANQNTTNGELIELPRVEEFNKKQYSLSDPDSIWVIVNRERSLPSDYAPSDLRDVDIPTLDKPAEELQLRAPAASALEALVAAASQEGLTLRLGSGFRSYASQSFYYNNYVAAHGQAEADRFSARPGHSEHQTGLAADLAGATNECYLEVCFAELPEGEWLQANADDFGFIIRYPADKEQVTGYMYEPWHLRYVGVELARELIRRSETMEEFFGLYP